MKENNMIPDIALIVVIIILSIVVYNLVHAVI